MEDISVRWPFWTEAEHTKQYYTRVPVIKIFADPWHTGRLIGCLARCRENPDPPPVDLVRIDVKGLTHEFFISADGNHRVVACQQLGIETIRASCYTVHYGPVLLKLALRGTEAYYPARPGWWTKREGISEERMRELVALQKELRRREALRGYCKDAFQGRF